MSSVKVARCPKCNGLSSNEEGHGLMHGAMHSVGHGIRHGNPLFVGIGIFAAGVQAVKNHWYRCKNCGHGYFAR